MAEDEKPVQKLWFTTEQLRNHIQNMSDKAEMKYHERLAKRLGAWIESTLVPVSNKH